MATRGEVLDKGPPVVYPYAYEGNDLCKDAVLLEATHRKVKFGSNMNVTTVDGDNQQCATLGYGGVDNEAAGVWYAVVGTGATLQADTCAPRTDFDTAIQVFVGDCDALQCVVNGGSTVDDSCRFTEASAVTFDTENDVVYYIHVFGRTADDVGTFVLSLVPV
jgi:hypothetical protein